MTGKTMTDIDRAGLVREIREWLSNPYRRRMKLTKVRNQDRYPGRSGS